MNGYKVLILEDEISINRGIAFSVERAGFEAVCCHTVAEAKVAAATGDTDIIICDINLPDGSGLDFIAHIRSLDMKKRPYIICLTVLDTETDYVLGYESGADDYICKPFSLSVLMLKLEAFVNRSSEIDEEKPADEIVSGKIRFSPGKMEARVDGKSVSLTKNECKLLGVFLKNPQQVLSKQQLLMQAFDIYDNFVDENTIAVNISRLREKLGDEAQNPEYIKNMRGLGYIWMKKLQ